MFSAKHLHAKCLATNTLSTIMNKVGKIGEDIACRIIAGLGYVVIKRNIAARFGEIDVIAGKAGKIIFFEVKTLTNKNVTASHKAYL